MDVCTFSKDDKAQIFPDFVWVDTLKELKNWNEAICLSFREEVESYRLWLWPGKDDDYREAALTQLVSEKDSLVLVKYLFYGQIFSILWYLWLNKSNEIDDKA